MGAAIWDRPDFWSAHLLLMRTCGHGLSFLHFVLQTMYIILYVPVMLQAQHLQASQEEEEDGSTAAEVTFPKCWVGSKKKRLSHLNPRSVKL
jgi:hypothetical protein